MIPSKSQLAHQALAIGLSLLLTFLPVNSASGQTATSNTEQTHDGIDQGPVISFLGIDLGPVISVLGKSLSRGGKVLIKSGKGFTGYRPPPTLPQLPPATIRLTPEGITDPTGGVFRGGAYDPQTNTLYLGAGGHADGMAYAGGSPDIRTTPGVSLVEEANGQVKWANDAQSLHKPVTAEQRSAIQRGLEETFEGRRVIEVGEIGSNTPLSEAAAEAASASRLGIAMKWVGGVLLVVGIGVSLYNIFSAPKGQRTAIACQETGGWVGGLAGGFAGMKFGAALGAVGGPYGIAFGGVVGGLIGSFAGAFAGSALGKKICQSHQGDLSVWDFVDTETSGGSGVFPGTFTIFQVAADGGFKWRWNGFSGTGTLSGSTLSLDGSDPSAGLTAHWSGTVDQGCTHMEGQWTQKGNLVSAGTFKATSHAGDSGTEDPICKLRTGR